MGSNPTRTSSSLRQSRIHFEPNALGSCTNIPRQSTSSSPLQSGPKSPPTCSRVGLAWVRHATSPNLLQRRSASRGGSRFNVGQPKAYPEFIQNLRSVAQAEATGGATPFSNSDPLSGNGPPGHWLLKTCKLRVSNPAAATILSGRIVLAVNRPTENRQSSVRVRFLPQLTVSIVQWSGHRLVMAGMRVRFPLVIPTKHFNRVFC